MTDPAPAVPADWFRRAFGGDYLRVYRRRSDAAGRREAAFAAEALGLAPGDRVLDLACGAGRHTAPLVESGFEVVGLDLSRPLLGEARVRLAAVEGPSRGLVVGDMRHLPFARGFRAVLSFFTSFGYFSADGDDRRVLGEMARVTEPGGGLLLDLPDRETVIEGLVPRSEREEEGARIEERRWITPDGRRVEKEILVHRDGASERYHESVRLYRHDEIETKLAAAGWRVERRVGDFEGAPWEAGVGPRMITVARREDER